MENHNEFCPICKRKVPPSRGKKPRTYCSRGCTQKAHYQRFPERQQARCQKWRRDNPEKFRQSKANWKARNLERDTNTRRNWWYQREYGMSLEQYNSACAQRDNRCDICGEQHKLKPDHDHGDGRVRGMLCNRCNLALGLFRDSPKILMNAITYLSVRKESVARADRPVLG